MPNAFEPFPARIGRWKDGRFGIARGLSTEKPGAPYGGVIFTGFARD